MRVRAAVKPPIPLLRPLVHMAVGGLALLLGVLSPTAALLGAVLGVVVGWVVLPRTRWEARLRRKGEPWLCGLRTYPLAVLLVVWLLDPAQAAAAWGVMAMGDSCAALVGTRVPSPSLFGHAKATWVGSGAYVLFGTLGAVLLSRGCAALGAGWGGVDTGVLPTLAGCALAALTAALLDLLPLPPDDNLPAAAGAGGILWLLRGTP